MSDVARRGRPARARPGPPPRPRRLPLTAAGETTTEFLLLTATAAVLLVLGLVMTFSASFVHSAGESGDAFGIFQRQLLWCAIGLPPMVLAASVDYRLWRRMSGPALAVTLLAVALVLVPSIGHEVNGARRWLDLGPLRFQPTEVLKLTLPLYLAHVLDSRWARLRRGDIAALLSPAVPLIALAAGLVVLEPDLETALLVALIGGLVLYTAGLPGRLIAVGVAGGAALVAAGVAARGFRQGRLLAWLDPMAYPTTFGYQSLQGFMALGSGGWFGVGLGQGRGKWLFLPNPHTDFIFAIIGEELGLLGAMFVLALFAALAVGGLRTARRAPDPFGRLLATAITGWLVLQAGINIGSVVGLMPVTGVTLPLVSFGGSSLLFTLLGMGILLSIARAGRPVADDVGSDSEQQ
ncbi:MAG TPA: putative lipid II flippase FtsW [Egibacteraceae bacterium]|nr:putative lipid II flippase FtsW [Egibacteraceae bacterium]